MAERRVKLMTLCMVRDGERILLGMKKRGFGAGRWNGFGGKVRAGESIEAAAVRETREEAGIELADLRKAGVLDFEFKENPEQIFQVHIFEAGTFSGEPVESEEMKPAWFRTDSIPYDEMWSDDMHWIPTFLAGKRFKGRFLFDASDAVIEKELHEVQEI